MDFITDTVAIATMSSRVCEMRDTAVPYAPAVAALKVTGPPDALTFALHTHVPASAARLTVWIDALVTDDPLLVGHRLARTSRLLIASGYIRNLGATFNHTGRCEILDVIRRCPTPLSTAALLNGVMAVDEEALVHRRSVDTGSPPIWHSLTRSRAGSSTFDDRRGGVATLLSSVMCSANASMRSTRDAAMTCPVQ